MVIFRSWEGIWVGFTQNQNLSKNLEVSEAGKQEKGRVKRGRRKSQRKFVMWGRQVHFLRILKNQWPCFPILLTQRLEGERLPSSSCLPWLRAARGSLGHTLPPHMCWLACTRAWGLPGQPHSTCYRGHSWRRALSVSSELEMGTPAVAETERGPKRCDWDPQTSSTDGAWQLRICR